MSLLTRVEAGLRAVSSSNRTVERAGGFMVAVAQGGGGAAGLAVAVPESPSPSLADALVEVERCFARRRAPASIEYVEELHPGLAEAAHARGWRTATVAPVMVLDTPAALGRPIATRADVRALRADDEGALRRYLTGQHAAYGGHGEPLAWLPLLRAGLAAGSVHAMALEVAAGIVAGASLQLGAGVGELAGVWTDPRMRRRGYAQAVCAALLADAFGRGLELAWLSAAPGATGLYERLGFERVGTQRTLDGPPGPADAGSGRDIVGP